MNYSDDEMNLFSLKPNLNFLEIALVSSRKLAVFNIYLYFSDIDDCNPNPCENGSTCSDKVNDYNCTCMAGYFGKNCSQGMILLIIFLSLYFLRLRLHSRKCLNILLFSPE